MSLVLLFLICVLYKRHKIQDAIHVPIICGNRRRRAVIVGKPAPSPSCHRHGAQPCGHPHPLWLWMVTLVELLPEQTSWCSGVTTAPARLSPRPAPCPFTHSPVPSGTRALTTENRCLGSAACSLHVNVGIQSVLSFLLFEASVAENPYFSVLWVLNHTLMFSHKLKNNLVPFS